MTKGWRGPLRCCTRHKRPAALCSTCTGWLTQSGWLRGRTAFSKPAATSEQIPDMDLTEATMKRLTATIAQMEELKVGQSRQGPAHAAPVMKARDQTAADVHTAAYWRRDRTGTGVSPVQVERTSRGKQLMVRLSELWAAMSPSEAAEGRAAVEAAMASSAAVHCTTLAKVDGRCLPSLGPGPTMRKQGTCAQHPAMSKDPLAQPASGWSVLLGGRLQ